MTIYLPQLELDDFSFPSPYEALQEPNGLLAFGGDLQPQRIYSAYRQGIFPWYGPGEPILWWSPSPRAVFDPKSFTPARSVKKFQKKHNYKISINHATQDIITQCAKLRPADQTWLNSDMRKSYLELSKLGLCHSVEVWDDSELIGGLYGIQVGRLFCGESMFSIKTNASKIALWYFCQHFQLHGGQLIDCQVMNPHLLSLGAVELQRDDFLKSLLSFRDESLDKCCFIPQWLTLSSEG
ncbi:leucyl/phenylalanyl-tRNA--protein transferase [Vibrio alginolyticus]|nr:leucyl/phenylalanyl-tRNA--protein transferase [Vibrio alginolyticus]